MTSSTNPIIVLGAGPAGMAAALSLHTAGHKVVIYERHSEARPAGNILNLWPPPIKALGDMGVDIDDLGAPCHSTFRNPAGRIRADVQIPSHVVEAYGGGFVGMLRPDLYRRMLAALPAGTLQTGRTVTGINDRGDAVELTLDSGETVETPMLIGADGINSIVRAHLWGSEPIREHKLAIIGGYTFDMSTSATFGECTLTHSRTVQATYSSIRSQGRDGFQWWVLEAWDPSKPAPTDLHTHALDRAKGTSEAVAELIAATPKENLQRWPIRDRVPIKEWSKGRITLAGDAAHAVSPYAAYGAGMSICDGYFLGQLLHGIDLADTAEVERALLEYSAKRIPHTTGQVNQAYFLGKAFHHAPALLRPVRDFIFDRTPMLQKLVGEGQPREIMEQLEEMGDGILVR